MKSIFSGLTTRSTLLRTYVGSVLTLGLGFLGHTLGFIILARHLPSADIGLLALLSSMGSLGAACSEQGVSEMVRRRTSQHPASYPRALGHALVVILVLGMLCSAVLTLIAASTAALGNSFAHGLYIAGLIIPANVLSFVLIGLIEQAFCAHGDFRSANALNISFGLARALAAAVACIGFGVSDLQGWAPWHFGFYAVIVLFAAIALLRYGHPELGLLRPELPRGLTMTGWGLIVVLKQSADIFALSLVAPASFIGSYSIARRVLGVGNMPGQALDRSVYGNLVKAGQQSTAEVALLAARYALLFAPPMLAMSAAIYVLSPYITLVFGSKYLDAIGIIRTLAVIVILTGWQNLAFDALNAAEEHLVRLWVSASAAFVGTAIIVWGALSFGVDGALAGVVVAELLVTVALWVALAARARSAPKRVETAS